MEFSVRSFAVVSLLLLISLSTDMSGPLVVDAQICNPTLCRLHCSLQGFPGTGCCPGVGWSPCQCTTFCPFAEEVTAGETGEGRFIKETVIA